MRGARVVVGLLLCGVGTAAAQEGVYLGSGPEFGLVFRLSEKVSLEPGIFVGFGSTREDRDSAQFRYHSGDAGLAAQLRWLAAPAAVLSPVVGFGGEIGREWSSFEDDVTYDNLGVPVRYHSEQSTTSLVWTATVRGGVQVRVSSRFAMSFEYVLGGTWTDGTQKLERTYSGTFPPTTSEQSSQRTTYRNGFVWRVRVYRGR